jgi:hypothetical protein
MAVARQKALAFLLDHTVDLVRDLTKIAVLRVCVDIEHRRAVVMIDDHRQNRRRQGCHLPRQLATIAQRMNRNRCVFKRVDRVDPVLQGLSSDCVGNSHLRIEPEIGLHGGTATERDINAARDILLSEAKLCRAYPVYVQVENPNRRSTTRPLPRIKQKNETVASARQSGRHCVP